MAQLLRRIDEEHYVGYGTFGLANTDLAGWQSPEGYHFLATVRLEAWDSEPPLPDPSWTPAERDTFVAESGVVHVLTMMDGRGHDFLIGPPLFEYGVAMYYRLLDGDPGEDECEEAWLLRTWPIRDVFDPLEHAAPFPYFARDVMGEAIDFPPERYIQPPAAREVPVPVSVAEDWVSLRVDPDADTFEGRLLRLRKWLSEKNVTVHEWLRTQGVDIEDGAELTPESSAPPGSRPGRFHDPLIDRYYAEHMQWDGIPQHVLGLESHEQEEWLRERSDGERIAKELCRAGSRTFSMPAEGRGAEYLPPGVSRRLWRWEDDYLGGESQDGGLMVDRRILARNPLTRQVFVSGIVTILRRDDERGAGGSQSWYVVRDAEPHEAARVLCAEATWEEDPERRRALDELAREKLAELRAAHGRPGN